MPDATPTATTDGDASLPPGLLEYFTARENARAERVAAKLAALTDRERALVREAAVMAYVHGTMHPQGQAHPKDSWVLHTVLLACDDHDDLYPTIAALGNREDTAD